MQEARGRQRGRAVGKLNCYGTRITSGGCMERQQTKEGGSFKHQSGRSQVKGGEFQQPGRVPLGFTSRLLGKPHSRGSPGLFAYPHHCLHLKLHSLTTFCVHRMFVLVPILLAASLVHGEAEADAEADPAILAHGYAEVAYCANGGYCVPPVHCAPYYLESLYDPAAPCYLAHGTPGVCCPPKKAPCK